jgi:hypothetical protein
MGLAETLASTSNAPNFQVLPEARAAGRNLPIATRTRPPPGPGIPDDNTNFGSSIELNWRLPPGVSIYYCGAMNESAARERLDVESVAGVIDISSPSTPNKPGAFLHSVRRPGKEE